MTALDCAAFNVIHSVYRSWWSKNARRVVVGRECCDWLDTVDDLPVGAYNAAKRQGCGSALFGAIEHKSQTEQISRIGFSIPMLHCSAIVCTV
jgi:hypothetical protein